MLETDRLLLGGNAYCAGCHTRLLVLTFRLYPIAVRLSRFLQLTKKEPAAK